MTDETHTPHDDYAGWLSEVGLSEFLTPAGIRINGLELSNQDFRNSGPISLDSVRLKSPQFDRGTFGKLSIERSVLEAASFQKCIQLGEVKFEDVRFVSSSFARASLWKARLSRVTFADCDLLATSFADAHLVDVEFERCRFRKTIFKGAVLDRVSVIDPTVEGPIYSSEAIISGDTGEDPFQGLWTDRTTR